MARKKIEQRGKNYTPEAAEEVLKLAREGKTNAQIAKAMGLCKQTIEKWTTQKDELIEAIKLAKEPTDNTVEATLLQKALGYHKETIKLFFDTKTSTVVEHKYTEFVEPDTTSIIFWLKNRQPEKWRDVKKIDLDNVNEPAQNAVLSDIGNKIAEALGKWTDGK